jgi:hypothetical protein
MKMVARAGESNFAKSLISLARVLGESSESVVAKSLISLMAKAKA